MNLFAFLPILSVMMIVHELGHFITARMAGITVQEFGIGLPPRLWGFRHGGVLYSINLIPFGAFVKMLGEEDPSAPGSFASKSRAVRALVLSAGSGMNFLLAVAAFAVAFMIGLPTVSPDGPVKLAGIAAESPAEQAGLRKGDEVVTFNGQHVNVGQFRELAQQHLGKPVELGVRRGEAELAVTLTPRPNPPKGQGTMGVMLDANGGMVRASPLRALQLGVDQTVRAVGMTFLVPKLVLDGAIAPGDARPIGLPGMAKLTADAVDDAVATQLWFPVFMLTGMFSAGLSVANMLPIPALDGGRLLFVVIEWVRRGRRVPPEREAAYHFVGIVLLLTLMVIISVNDIVSPVPRIDWGIR